MIKKIMHFFRKMKNDLSLSNKGERVDITYNKNLKFEKLDMYQKSHLKRYEYAKQIVDQKDVVGDFACGTGYGTSMLSEKSSKVIGVDIDDRVIKTIKKRYKKNKKVKFIASDILNIKYKNYFDKIISFETIEHFPEENITSVLNIFYHSLKKNGKIIFSVPYKQEKNHDLLMLGFHKTFNIDEQKVKNWLTQTNFKFVSIMFQNYITHKILGNLTKKDFMICIACKKSE